MCDDAPLDCAFWYVLVFCVDLLTSYQVRLVVCSWNCINMERFRAFKKQGYANLQYSCWLFQCGTSALIVWLLYFRQSDVL